MRDYTTDTTGQLAQQDTSPGAACHYLVCHGVVQETNATLAGVTVGVYTSINESLLWQDARNILKHELAPIYEPIQGDFREYDLSAISAHELKLWKKYEPVPYGDRVEFLTEDQTLSEYLGTFSQSRHGQKLRLLACADLSVSTSQPRRLYEPKTWSSTAIKSQTNGTLFKLRIAENTAEQALLITCARSWDEGRGILDRTDKDLLSAFALKGGLSLLAVTVWEAWEKKPDHPEHVTEWLAFLEVLTPNDEAATDLYKTWKDEGHKCQSLATVLEETCNAIDEMLADAEQLDEIYSLNPCAVAFRDSGWAKRATKLVDYEDELSAYLLDDEGTEESTTVTTASTVEQVPVPTSPKQHTTPPGPVVGQPSTATEGPPTGVQMKRSADKPTEVLQNALEESEDDSDDT